MSADDWLRHIRSINPYAEALYVSDSREAFLDAAERLIARVVHRMESSRSTYRKLGEIDLSQLITDLLGELVPATPETRQNGHVDVTISHPRCLEFKHLTECKIWDGPAWHQEGMTQLLGYATGREGRVLCLAFFIRHKGMVVLLNRLREQLGPEAAPPALGPAEDHPLLSGAFITRHQHSSGAELRIVHLGCHLWQEGNENH